MLGASEQSTSIPGIACKQNSLVKIFSDTWMLLETTLNSLHVWAIGHNIPNNILLGIYYLLNAMGKDHHNPWFQDHVVTDVSVVTSHHHHRLLSRDPPGCVLLVLPAQFSVSTFQITSKSYLRFICRVSNVCRPGGHRRSCAFSISSVTVLVVTLHLIKHVCPI